MSHARSRDINWQFDGQPPMDKPFLVCGIVRDPAPHGHTPGDHWWDIAEWRTRHLSGDRLEARVVLRRPVQMPGPIIAWAHLTVPTQPGEPL